MKKFQNSKEMKTLKEIFSKRVQEENFLSWNNGNENEVIIKIGLKYLW